MRISDCGLEETELGFQSAIRNPHSTIGTLVTCHSSLSLLSSLVSQYRRTRIMDNVKEAATAPASAPAAGLRGVVAASTSIGDVNGEKGELIYQGINIHDLAKNSTFEEVIFLLWNGRLPKRAELDELKRNIAANYQLSPEILTLMRQFPQDTEPMDTLRTAVSALAFYDKNARDISRDNAV